MPWPAASPRPVAPTSIHKVPLTTDRAASVHAILGATDGECDWTVLRLCPGGENRTLDLVAHDAVHAWIAASRISARAFSTLDGGRS